jgi:hypothetical protein
VGGSSSTALADESHAASGCTEATRPSDRHTFSSPRAAYACIRASVRSVRSAASLGRESERSETTMRMSAASSPQLMDVNDAIPCVIYAAKRTEDERGTIQEQLRDCRAAIEADPRRRLTGYDVRVLTLQDPTPSATFVPSLLLSQNGVGQGVPELGGKDPLGSRRRTAASCTRRREAQALGP